MENNQYKILREMAINATKNAYMPYSKCAVGSALLTNTGEYFSGCNIENASYGGSVCAERVAIWKAISANKNIKIKIIYVYTEEGWPPCGMCRQVMAEFADEDLQVVIGNFSAEINKISFKDLLPHQFDHSQLAKQTFHPS
jgi:cytidine deaminase